jgi:hypothetical protein
MARKDRTIANHLVAGHTGERHLLHFLKGYTPALQSLIQPWKPFGDEDLQNDNEWRVYCKKESDRISKGTYRLSQAIAD